MLQDATNNVRGLVKDIEAGTYSTETGVKANDMISRWLEQVLLLELSKVFKFEKVEKDKEKVVTF